MAYAIQARRWLTRALRAEVDDGEGRGIGPGREREGQELGPGQLRDGTCAELAVLLGEHIPGAGRLHFSRDLRAVEELAELLVALFQDDASLVLGVLADPTNLFFLDRLGTDVLLGAATGEDLHIHHFAAFTMRHPERCISDFPGFFSKNCP